MVLVLMTSLTTEGGATLAKYKTPKDSIKAFIDLMKTGSAYEGVRKAINQKQTCRKYV